MKKNIYLTILLLLCFIICGCNYSMNDIIYNTIDIPNTNDCEIEFVSFLPTEATLLNVDEIRIAFINSEYSHDMAVEYKGFYNYMPEEYSKKYEIDVFEVIDHQNQSKYYLKHADNIYNIATSYGIDNNEYFKGVVNFAISDMNSDGHFELLISWYGENKTSYSYISAFDSNTHKFVKSFIWTPDYYFFKKDTDKIAIYGSNDNCIDNATTLYSEILVNNKQYFFKQKEFAVTSTNFKAIVTIEEETINFPLIFKDLSLEYSCNVVMTYLGETFSYENSNDYLAGAFANFKNESQSINVVSWAVSDVVVNFTIETGQVIDRTYYYYETLWAANSLGVYDVVVNYRGEYVIVDDILEIVSK